MDVDKLIQTWQKTTRILSFGTMMDVDKLIQSVIMPSDEMCFGTMMDVDKLIRKQQESDIKNVLGL